MTNGDFLPAAAPASDGRAEAGLAALAEASLEPAFWHAERLGMASAWWQHVPFAHWLVSVARPDMLVELGAHAGVSYAAFCQAVQRLGLATKCFAVDSWRGDRHSGSYDASVFEEFDRYHRAHFASFSTLIRARFDEALARFEDRSIDLLHIDGFHTYEAVRHDLESWLPKLSARGVVLFHDTNERSRDFGVWRYWEEIRERYPSFSFPHGHGLGVLAVGPQAPPPVLSLCRIADPLQVEAIRARFARLGERWDIDTQERLQARRAGELAEEAERLKRVLARAQQDMASSQARLLALVGEVDAARSAALAQARRDAARIAAAATELAEARASAERAEAALAAAGERSAGLEAVILDLRAQLHLARTRADNLQAEAASIAGAYHAVLASTAWRATGPARRLAEALRSALRRPAGGRRDR
jgi:hypothetical protein